MAFTGQWQSPPPATISPTNTITLSESERNSNNPFPIFPRLNCHLLLLLSSPFVSLPPFHVVQLYQGNSLERVGKLRVSKRFASSYLSLSLCLSLLSLASPVIIKINKIFDSSIRKRKEKKIRFPRLFLSFRERLKSASLQGIRLLLSIFAVRSKNDSRSNCSADTRSSLFVSLFYR